MNRQLQYPRSCEALVQAVRDAANPAMPEWSPYVGSRTRNAVWWTRYCCGEARALGLARPEPESVREVA